MKIQPLLSFLVTVLPIYWTCLCHNIFVVSGLCLHNQGSLLLQLKNNLTYDNESSSKLKLWNQSIDCCHWSGVTCDDEGDVIGLDLSGESISDGFDNSSSLFSLHRLQSLNLAANNFNSMIPSRVNKLGNLMYLNLSNADFVGQIPTGISQLTRLITLDISSLPDSDQDLELKNPNLQKLVQNLTSIRQLYLDGVFISAQGQEWCNALLMLPGLQELSLSNCNLSGPLVPSLTRLENLSVIRLDENYLSSPVPETFANFKSLTALSLVHCQLTGTFPRKIFQVRTLSFIDISDNYDLHASFPEFPLNASLQTLRVHDTPFSGLFPDSIGNMRHLSELDLSFCQFMGALPKSLSNLTELSYLDLSNNNFTGPIPSFGMAQKLTHIDLSSNGLSGAIPSSLFTLPSLQNVLLSHNQFSQLEGLTNVSSSMLDTLDLSSNNLAGPIPSSIFHLKGLSTIILSSNKFNGSMQLSKLSELQNLIMLDLSYNNLLVNVNVTDADLSSFPKVTKLYLASCSLKTFPDFLRYQSGLTDLDLSNNQIQGTVPNWVWKLDHLQIFNISHNFLTDLEGPFPTLGSNLGLVLLDLHDNQLQGPIPFIPKFATYLDYSSNRFNSVIPVDIGDHLSLAFFLSFSNNSLHGRIPNTLCDAYDLQVLDLSHNEFSGMVPSCLMKYLSGTLEVLNLGSNNLTGPIPNTFPASCALRTIGLNGNVLDGQLPKSLANCTTLEVLDLGRNQITGGFPCFLNNISTLRVLVLRNNEFHGPIGCPRANGVWHMLQIADLAFNRFSGKLPGKHFTSWKAMMSDEGEAKSEVENIRTRVNMVAPIYYQDSVTIISKGLRMELVKILTVFTSIDFSYNQFEGLIPEELMDFKALYVLNLTNNALSGQIPSSIGNLKKLESLDLSNNSLEGEIPNEIASLNFLSFLNLSFNHLTGRIPTGTQLQSFQASSFIGNEGLYGPPLTQSHPDDGNKGLPPPAPLPPCGRLACEVHWNFVSAELGLVFGLGIVIGPLLFWKKWRLWYWQLLDKILCRIFPQLSLEYETRRGQSYKVLVWRH